MRGGMWSGRPSRGGITAIAGWVAVMLGLAFFFAALGEAFTFVSAITSTALAAPDPTVGLTFALVGVSVGSVTAGGLLIGFAGGERSREEDRALDPLSYAPFHYPVRKVLPVLAVTVGVLVVASLWIVPVSHSFRAEFAVGECNDPASFPAYSVELPASSILAYYWSTSDGRPVSEVWAPNGPQVEPNRTVTNEFFDSSYGYSSFESNGSAVGFWACDVSASGVSNRSIVLTGTYYQWVL